MKNWYVIYTRSKWEKKIDLQLKQYHFESFCPVIKRTSQWADRKKIVEVPLFTSYVFVKINQKEEVLVRRAAGILNFVNHCGKPVKVRDEEIGNIRQYLAVYDNLEVVNLNNLHAGSRVKINQGAFENCEGEVVAIDGKKVLMVLEALGCVITTRLSVNQISIIK